VAGKPLRPGYGKPVVVESERAARVLTEAARLNASKTPDVDERTARRLVAEINEREGHRVDYD
jgi:hypothetical protein